MRRTIPFIRPGGLLFSILLLLISTTLPACSTRVSIPSATASPDSFKKSEKREQPQEVVVIDNKTYSIPPPWIGSRIVAPKFDYTDFRQIPVEYTHKGSSIYILASAHGPLVEMLQAAKADGITLKAESAYRGERYQKQIFKRMLAEGRTFEDIVRYVAPPGYSQHVLGTAVDFFPSNWRFADTPDYAWLKENARQFDFAETFSRFNKMKMPWEAWHWNYTRSAPEKTILPRLAPGSQKKSQPGPTE
jgi:LAS superfamily LD-carboxypeptidase LdcB